MCGEDLFQQLQRMTPEQRKCSLMVQVPSAEYDSYFTQPTGCTVLNIEKYNESENGTPTICITVE